MVRAYHLLLCVLLLMIVLPAVPVRAGVVVSLNNEGSTTLHEITVQPGDTFAIDINMSVSYRLYDIDMSLEASAAGVFDIVSGYAYFPWEVHSYYTFPLGGIDSITPPIIIRYSQGDHWGPGNATLATLNLEVDEQVSQGTYFLQISDDVFYRSSPIVLVFTPAQTGPDFVVHVVPEPSNLVLLGSLAIWSCRRRRSSVITS